MVACPSGDFAGPEVFPKPWRGTSGLGEECPRDAAYWQRSEGARVSGGVAEEFAVAAHGPQAVDEKFEIGVFIHGVEYLGVHHE